jgi:hypothetical protein
MKWTYCDLVLEFKPRAVRHDVRDGRVQHQSRVQKCEVDESLVELLRIATVHILPSVTLPTTSASPLTLRDRTSTRS